MARAKLDRILLGGFFASVISWNATFPQSALAAQLAAIEADSAEVVEIPRDTGTVLESIPKGKIVTISNQPVEGYYKIRTESGKIGWIKSDQIRLNPQVDTRPSTPEPPSPESSSEREPEQAPEPDRYSKKPKRNQSRNKESMFLRGMGGASYFTLSDISTQLGYDGLKLSTYLGGEFGLRLSDVFFAVARVEYLFRTSVAIDVLTSLNYQHSVKSLPILAGVEYHYTESETWDGHIALLAGFATGTTMQTVSLSSAASPTVLEGSGIAAMAKTGLTYRFPESSFGLSAELGYRFVKTAALIPSQTGSSSVLYQLNGAYVPLVIDLSGPFAGIGLSIHF